MRCRIVQLFERLFPKLRSSVNRSYGQIGTISGGVARSTALLVLAFLKYEKFILRFVTKFEKLVTHIFPKFSRLHFQVSIFPGVNFLGFAIFFVNNWNALYGSKFQ